MATALTSPTTGFSPEAFAEFLSRRDEPDWLVARRKESFARFLEMNMPTTRDEEWMRTDIRTFKLDRFGLPKPLSADIADHLPPAVLREGVELGGAAAAVNSNVVSAELDEDLARQGVLFGSLEDLLRQHGDRLRPYVEREIVDPGKDKFAALHAACFSGGTLLFVPAGVKIDRPLHSFSVLAAEGGAAGVDFSKTFVVLEDGAEATLLSETASSDAESGGLHCGSIELHVGKAARMRYVNLQNWNTNVWHFAHQKGQVAAAGRLQWTIGALGSRLAKVNQHVGLDGEDAWVQVNGVMFTEGKQHLSYHTHQHHQAPSCHSDLLYKTALQDRSRTVWRGMIQVDRIAQQTDAYQRNDNLLLSARRPSRLDPRT